MAVQEYGVTTRDISSHQEETLVRRCQQGDACAFDRLVELCAPRVIGILYRQLNNMDDAQDAAQEVFIRLYRALPRFRGDSAFFTFLYRIIHHVAADEIKRRPRRAVPLTSLLTEDEDEFRLFEMLQTGDSAEEAALAGERRRVIQSAIQQIPEPFRLVFILSEVEGLPDQEIASALQTQLGTVKSRLNRARKHFRENILQHRELFRE